MEEGNNNDQQPNQEDNNNNQQPNQIEEKQIDNKQNEEIKNQIDKDACIDTEEILVYTGKTKTKGIADPSYYPANQTIDNQKQTEEKVKQILETSNNVLKDYNLQMEKIKNLQKILQELSCKLELALGLEVGTLLIELESTENNTNRIWIYHMKEQKKDNCKPAFLHMTPVHYL